MAQPLLDLVGCTSVEAEFDVAKTCIAKLNGNKTKPTTTKLLFEHCEALKAMPSVHLALKLGITFGASTAKSENSFSVPKTIMQDAGNWCSTLAKVIFSNLRLKST